MIYLAKNQSNLLISDSLIDYLPEQVSLFLDDVLIGSFANISDTIFYHTVVVNSTDIDSFQEREYKLKWVDNGSVIKTELCVVKNFSENIIKSITKQKTLKFYE